jgi:hypothetical protein
MKKLEQKKPAEEHHNGHPKVDVRENAGCAAARWFPCAHRFFATPNGLVGIIHVPVNINWLIGR